MVSVIEALLLKVFLNANAHGSTYVVIYSNFLFSSCSLDKREGYVSAACILSDS